MTGPLRPRDLSLLAAVALATRLFAAWAIPFAAGAPDANCAPDEAAHQEATRALVHGDLRSWPEGPSIYRAFPPSQYAAQVATALALRPVGEIPPRFPSIAPGDRGYLNARLGSVLLGIATVLALALAAAAWTGARQAGLACGLVAALYPQLFFVDAYVNADAYTIAAGALLTLALTRWARAGECAAGTGLLGASAGLVLAGKMSGYYLLPPTGLWLGWAATGRKLPGRELLRVAGLALLVGAPPLLFNAWRNGGDPIGLARYHQFLETIWHGKDGRAIPGALGIFARTLWYSSFGIFGNMSLLLRPGYYAAALILVGIGLAAAALSLTRAAPVAWRGAAWLVGASLANLALTAWNSWRMDFQPQGRYVLLSAVTLACVAGWAPAARVSGRARLAWIGLYLGFFAVAAYAAERVLWLRPCL